MITESKGKPLPDEMKRPSIIQEEVLLQKRVTTPMATGQTSEAVPNYQQMDDQVRRRRQEILRRLLSQRQGNQAAKSGENTEAQFVAKQPAELICLEVYGRLLKQAWLDGEMGSEEKAILETFRLAIGITENDHAKMERSTHMECLREALIRGWLGGALTVEEAVKLDKLRSKFRVAPEEYLSLEKEVRHQILKLPPQTREAIKEVWCAASGPPRDGCASETSVMDDGASASRAMDCLIKAS